MLQSAAGMLVELKRLARYRAWARGHPAFLLSRTFDRERNLRRGFTDEDHLRAAAQWLAAAQDSQSDGGVAGKPGVRAVHLPDAMARHDYLFDPEFADVFARIAEHPVQRLDELLPWNWSPLNAQARQAA